MKDVKIAELFLGGKGVQDIFMIISCSLMV